MTFPLWLDPLPDAAQQRAIDAWAINERGIPGATLMERAGSALALFVDDLIPRGPISIVCGKGNNGGDGKIAGRVLHDLGRTVEVLTPDDCATGLSGPVAVIDALLGTGTSGAPRKPIAGAIRAINEARDAGAVVFACDIPSGVNGSTGEVPGEAVRADHTVTFHAAKPGLWINPGKHLAGQLTVVDIGIPDGAPVEPWIGLLTARVLDQVPRRTAGSNKFTAGSVLIVGGSPGLTGAPVMTARAAARAGAGYVTIGAPSAAVEAISAKTLEVMCVPLEQAFTVSQKACALVLGPGLGAFREVARGHFRDCECPLVIDADGLNAHAGRLAEIGARVGQTVLTPHVGELARLLASDSQNVNAHRLTSAQKAAELTHAVVALKGDDTIITSRDGTTAVSPGGAPALATAGTGDVLAGIVGTFLAKGMEPFTAACAAVWLHLRAGQLAGERIGPEGVIASDVIELLPGAWA